MKVYLDTTVITLLLFGAQTDPTRHQEVTDFFRVRQRQRAGRWSLSTPQAHAATAYHVGCEAIVTYDRHYQDIADRISVLTAAQALARLTKDRPAEIGNK